jgi:IMP dehydrogenase
MTRDVQIANPDQSIRDVAQIMADCNIGSLPVGEHDRLVGMITDRDIAVRAVAQGRSPDTRVREVMTDDVKYCFEDEEVSTVAQNLGDIQKHRLPVVNRDKRLVGIVALADIANCEGARPAGQAVCGISSPTGQQQAGSGSSSQQQHQSTSSQRPWASGQGQMGSSQQAGMSGGQSGSSSQQSQSGSSSQQDQPGSSRQQHQAGPSQPQQQGAGQQSESWRQQQAESGRSSEQSQPGSPTKPRSSGQ